jgi:prophage regulatory protein
LDEPLINDRILGYELLKSKIGNISRSSIWRWERDGLFPRRVQVGPRRVGWRESQVNQWIASRGEATQKLKG